MKIKNTLNIIAGLALLAVASRTRAQCPQSCDGNNTAIGTGALSENNSGLHNTAVGYSAGFSILSGSYNTAVGDTALGFQFIGCSQGSFNTALGANALTSNSGANNTGIGANAMSNIGCGSDNTATGEEAMFGGNGTDYYIQGSNNTATGYRTLFSLTSGNHNTADGYQALYSNTTGSDNVAIGRGALYNNSASNNTADGSQALNKNTTGTDNVAIGRYAMFFNVTGNDNTAIGRGALYNNTTSNNTATGYQALNKNTSGPSNTANGYQALYNNLTGFNNSATGSVSLYNSTSGWSNTANGQASLYSNTTGTFNTALGSGALYGNSTGASNIAVGSSAGVNLTTGSNNIDIGSFGLAGESTTIRVGTVGTHANTYIAGISGVTVAGGIGVVVDGSGHLGTSTSSARYKENIQPMDKASETILSLQPVTFRYKKKLDPKAIPQFGLVAEQVDKIDPDLVARDEEGKPYSVRYEAVNAMLLNEFLKEHRKVEEQARKMESLERAVVAEEKENEAMRAMLRQQAAQIQNVSEQLAITPPLTRLVVSRGTRSVPSLEATPSASKSGITK